jgi:hypothetical protein
VVIHFTQEGVFMWEDKPCQVCGTTDRVMFTQQEQRCLSCAAWADRQYRGRMARDLNKAYRLSIARLLRAHKTRSLL